MTLPSDLSDLLFWYRADDVTVGSGQPLNNAATLWPDHGPNGWNITSFTGTNCPTLGGTAGPNGLPGVVYDGTAYLNLPAAALAALANKPGATVFVLVSMATANHAGYSFHASTGANNSAARMNIQHASSASSPRPLSAGGRRLDSDSFASVSNPASVADNTFYIECAYADFVNNAIGVRFNGGTWTTDTTAFTSGGGNSDTANSVAIHIGGNPGASPVSVQMTIVEIFAFGVKRTDTEMAQMDSYLSDRSGIIVADYTTGTTATVPDPPVGVSASPGNGQATVSFTPPSNNGGAAITGYTATSTPGGITASAASSPITVPGLTNGTSYTFTVHATNSVGNSAESAASNAVIPTAPPPATAPGAPTGVTAVGGDSEAIVSWTPPASDGGATITGYTVTGMPGGSATTAGTNTSVAVTGLVNGTAYTFTVHATNSVGNSAESSPSNSVTPESGAGVPPSFVRKVSEANTNVQDPTMTLPAGITSGDLLLSVFGLSKGTGVSASAPAGTTTLFDVSTGPYSNDKRAIVSDKIAAAGDSGAVWTFPSGWANDTLAVLEYTGMNAATPIDVTPICHQSNNGSLESMNLQSAGCLLVYGFVTQEPGVITDPPGFTKRVDVKTAGTTTQDPHLVIYDKVQANAGATDPIPATISGSTATVAFLIALRPAVVVNQPPIANAGPDQTVAFGAVVTLHGAGDDPEGSPITYSWRQISGDAVTLSDPTAAQPTFTAPSVAETLTFGLTVNDGTTNSAEDTVDINIQSAPSPVTNLIAVQTETTVELSWTPSPSSNIDHIEIRRADQTASSSGAPSPPATVNDGTQVAVLAPGINDYTDTGLTPATYYAYSVFVVDTLGGVSPSAFVTVLTDSPVPIWTKVVGTQMFPPGTVTVKLVLTFQQAAAGSEHWIDRVGIFAGQHTDWSRGGISDTGTVTVEYSDDKGKTWLPVRNGQQLPLAAAEFASVTDYEAPPGGTRMYRATIQNVIQS